MSRLRRSTSTNGNDVRGAGKKLDGIASGGSFGEYVTGSAPSTCVDYPRLLGRAGNAGPRGMAGANASCLAPEKTPQPMQQTYQRDQKDEESTRGGEVAGKGPISMLQEFVQCSREFRLPPRRPILSWSFETRMADFSTLEFRAIASFLLGGVPHHVAGAWHPSKKGAQRDTAERSLGFFVGRWGEQLMQSSSDTQPVSKATGVEVEEPSEGVGDSNASETLMRVVRSYQGENDMPPQWKITCDNGLHQAILEVDLLGVPHKFGGKPAVSEAAAREQMARRVLWYLQATGYADAFEPDPAATGASATAPPSRWASDASEEDALLIAERKTALMRVQNRLQQALAQQLKPGQGVWDWTYEPNHEEGGWPPLCRATVRVPVLGAEFTGGWARGHRAAQLEACEQVAQYLDQLYGCEEH